VKDSYIGKVIGNYRVLQLSDLKTSDGYKLYDAECIKCGTIVYHERISEFKRNNLGKECHHCQSSVKWYSSRLRVVFKDMLDRCYNASNSAFRFYGGKGILVCSEWLRDVQKFNDWAVLNGYDDSLTIDRIDSNLGYSPENCRWITREQNSKWKSTTNHIYVCGILDSGRGWSKRLGLNVNYVNKFLHKHGYDETVSMIQGKMQ